MGSPGNAASFGAQRTTLSSPWMLKTSTLAAHSSLPYRNGRFLTKREDKGVSSSKTHHNTFSYFLSVPSPGTCPFPWHTGALLGPAWPCPAGNPGSSSHHFTQPHVSESTGDPGSAWAAGPSPAPCKLQEKANLCPAGSGLEGELL